MTNSTSKEVVERLAAELWRVEAVDSGSPPSVAKARTFENFGDQAEATRDKWRKFACAAVNMMLDETCEKRVREVAFKDALEAIRQEFDDIPILPYGFTKGVEQGGNFAYRAVERLLGEEA